MKRIHKPGDSRKPVSPDQIRQLVARIKDLERPRLVLPDPNWDVLPPDEGERNLQGMRGLMGSLVKDDRICALLDAYPEMAVELGEFQLNRKDMFIPSMLRLLITRGNGENNKITVQANSGPETSDGITWNDWSQEAPEYLATHYLVEHVSGCVEKMIEGNVSDLRVKKNRLEAGHRRP